MLAPPARLRRVRGNLEDIMVWDGIERRRLKRFGLKGCTVQYKPARWWELFSLLSDRYLVLNISQGGLHFIAEEELTPGKQILLEITAPVLSSGVAHTLARVVWTKKSEQHNAYHIGVEFLKMSKQSRVRLKLILDNALLDQIDISTKIYLKEVDKLGANPVRDRSSF